ncbi:hypothetical protein HAX54_022269 [Datura stramonium]|uniref:Uncharacterized protein n=1 Tax=Datura stramonium TaxID=4076 RepID=A0ABS8S400_DATST|nr:hypothetical protein [Datura stramonium]
MRVRDSLLLGNSSTSARYLTASTNFSSSPDAIGQFQQEKGLLESRLRSGSAGAGSAQKAIEGAANAGKAKANQKGFFSKSLLAWRLVDLKSWKDARRLRRRWSEVIPGLGSRTGI